MSSSDADSDADYSLNTAMEPLALSKNDAAALQMEEELDALRSDPTTSRPTRSTRPLEEVPRGGRKRRSALAGAPGSAGYSRSEQHRAVSIGHPVTRSEMLRERIHTGVTALLALYDDAGRAGVAATPGRVARMYDELLTPRPFTFTTFDAEGADQMVLVRDIPFYTLCEHHIIPFFGTATVAYIPAARIAGLSKLARTVEYFARRLQTQERLTNQVADFLLEQLAPHGVGVVVHARHLCMEMRGVQKPGTSTVTSALRGCMLSESEARAEFLSLAYSGSGETRHAY